jgi:hypothetical protein
MNMSKSGWLGLLGVSGAVALIVFAWRKDLFSYTKPPPPPIPWLTPQSGPAALDPYEHALTITGYYNVGCSSSCAISENDTSAVYWHLTTSIPATVPPSDPLPELQGQICQAGTWGDKVRQACTDLFDIRVGELESKMSPMSPHLYLAVLASALPTSPPPPPDAVSQLNVELMVGAKSPDPTTIRPAMQSRAVASIIVTFPPAVPPP